jgi:hypothetical protein
VDTTVTLTIWKVHGLTVQLPVDPGLRAYGVFSLVGLAPWKPARVWVMLPDGHLETNVWPATPCLAVGQQGL